MQRYFFTLKFPNHDVVDPDGAMAPDLETAARDAQEAIREIAAEYLRGGTPLSLRGISICDAQGDVVAWVSVWATLDNVVGPIVSVPEGGGTLM
jgi:hypothetical protein